MAFNNLNYWNKVDPLQHQIYMRKMLFWSPLLLNSNPHVTLLVSAGGRLSDFCLNDGARTPQEVAQLLSVTN